MNLDLFKEQLIGKTARRFSWEEFGGDDDSVVLSTHCTFRPYDDDIALRVELHEEGFLAVKFTLDKISYNKECLKLVNYFNVKTYFFKAFIDTIRDKHYLFLEYTVPECKSVEDACNEVLRALDLLNDRSTATYLQPLTVITED